ncbi:MAG: ABC transporter substrate-binding protein, partial [Bacteroidales bacterium]|nr:ABC transporter substrate-binding protein [Bacteroidales bacterium]
MDGMNNLKKLIFALVFFPSVLLAQNPLNIGISKDAATGEFEALSLQVKSEIEALTQARGGVVFKEVTANWQTEKVNENLQGFLDDPEIDIVVTLGFLSSNAAAQLPVYPKPVIAATLLDHNLQGLVPRSDSSSGITNFTYIPSMIRLKSDMLTFHDLFEFKQLAVLIPEPLYTNFQPLLQFFNQQEYDFELSFIPVSSNSKEALAGMPASIDAAFVLPMIHYSPKETAALYDELNSKRIPSLAASGPGDLQLGASLTFTPQFTLLQMAREVALRVLKISEGTNLSEIPLSREENKRTPIVNMESMREIGKFPAKWQKLEDAILINIEKMPGESLELRQAIA